MDRTFDMFWTVPVRSDIRWFSMGSNHPSILEPVPYLVVISVGFVFGAADQYLGSRSALGAWASTVSLMSAPWVILPFFVGWTQQDARRALRFGLIVTVSALTGYFVMTYSPMEGVPIDRFIPGEIAIVTSGYNPLYILAGLLTGPAFGWLGNRWRVERSWMSAALVTAALCFEPLAWWAAGRLSPPALVWSAEVSVGMVVAAIFALSTALGRRRSVPEP
jgi:hypothetical protein